MKLFFRNSTGKEREIAEVDDRKNIFKVIEGFCAEKKYEIPYMRYWHNGSIVTIDVGSHTEFFIIQFPDEKSAIEWIEADNINKDRIGNLTFETFRENIYALEKLEDWLKEAYKIGFDLNNNSNIRSVEEHLITTTVSAMCLTDDVSEMAQEEIFEYCYGRDFGRNARQTPKTVESEPNTVETLWGRIKEVAETLWERIIEVAEEQKKDY